MESTVIAYVAGFLDGDGSVFFQIVRRKDYRKKFQVRSSIAFYQKTTCSGVLSWLKQLFGAGYIRHRKTGISDYTIVGSKEVLRILRLLQPFVRVKSRQVELGIRILEELEKVEDTEDFLGVCRMVDEFKNLNYSKKRTVDSNVVSASLSP